MTAPRIPVAAVLARSELWSLLMVAVFLVLGVLYLLKGNWTLAGANFLIALLERQAISLRRERDQAAAATSTVVVDGERHTLRAGDTLTVTR